MAYLDEEVIFSRVNWLYKTVLDLGGRYWIRTEYFIEKNDATIGSVE